MPWIALSENREESGLAVLFETSIQINILKLDRLGWRILIEEPLHGTRKRGRARLRWIVGVVTDSRNILGVGNDMTSAQDRDDWRRRLVEAKTRQWVVAPQ